MAKAGTFAAGTSVTVDQTRAEIERTLRRYGASAFGYMLDGMEARIAFRIGARHIRFSLHLPEREDKSITEYKRGEFSDPIRRTEGEIDKRWEQLCRQRWRALALVIKAKLEAVECGITTLEDEFLAATVLPSGETMGEWARPEINEAYRVGGMPTSLLIGAPRR